MNDALTQLGLTLRQDFQTWLTQLQLEDLSAEQPLGDQVKQLYQLTQDLTMYEQISQSWQYLEAWLTSEFLPSDAGGVDFSPPDPPVSNVPQPPAQSPTFPIDRPRMEYLEHLWSQGFDPMEPIASSASHLDPTSLTSRRSVSSSVIKVDRDQRLFAAEGAQTPAVIDRAVAGPIMPNRLSALSVLPDRLVSPSSGGDNSPSMESPVGTFSRLTPGVKGLKELSAFLQQAKSDSENVSAPTDPDSAPWLLPEQATQQSSQLGRSHKLRDTAEAILPRAINYHQPEAFKPSPTQDLISELAQFPPTLANTPELMGQQIKANVRGISEPILEPIFEPINMPIPQPVSGFINAPMSAPASAQRLGQSAMSLDEQTNPSTFPQRDSNSFIWLQPPPREAKYGWVDWTQDRSSPLSSQFVTRPLPQPPSQTDPDAGLVAPSEPSLLALDWLLEAIQQEINQDYDRFYGS